MTQVTTKDDVTILIDLPEKKQNRHVQPSFVKACYGDERVANVLDYFVYAASREAKDRGLKGCNVVTVTRTHEKILEKLQSKPSRKSLIRYLKKLNEWGYILSEPYKRDFEVHLDLIQEKVTTPPDIKPRERGCKSVGKGGHVTTLQPSKDEGKKVDMLQLKVDTLQQKVDMLQLKVDTLVTLQPALEVLQKLLEGQFSDASLYITSILPLLTCNSNVVSSDNESDDTLFSPSDDNQSSTDNVDNQTVNVDNTLQDDIETSLQKNTLEEEASERRIADVTTSDDVSESQPELPLERPKVPEMPPPGMRWSPKKMVMITECKRGSYYTEKMHESNLKAAQKIIKENVTEEEYIRAYEKRNDKWWKESRGPLDVTHMAAKTERGPMRTLEVLEELRYKQSNGHPTITDKANAKNTHSATQTYSPEDYDGGENERRQREAFMASQRGA